MRRRNGFTLLEILVVIGIITILLTLAVVGYNVVERSAAGNQTRVTLKNLDAMLAELSAQAGSSVFSSQPFNYTYTVGTSPNQVTYTLHFGAYPYGTNGYDPTPGATGIYTRVSDVTAAYTTTTPYSDRFPLPDNVINGPSVSTNVVGVTQNVIQYLMRFPQYATAIKQLPASQILSDTNSSGAPIILDGWGNPIIYVPADGLWVYVTSGNGPTLVRIQSPDKRPFFASAGPDGNFGGVYQSTAVPPNYGDDNVYSKE